MESPLKQLVIHSDDGLKLLLSECDLCSQHLGYDPDRKSIQCKLGLNQRALFPGPYEYATTSILGQIESRDLTRVTVTHDCIHPQIQLIRLVAPDEANSV